MNEAPPKAETFALAKSLPSGPRSYVRYLVLAWLAAATAIAYLCRQSIGVAESTIREDTGLSIEAMGLAMSAFFWSYAFSMIPAALAVQLLGGRRILPILSTLWSLATGLMAVVYGLPLLLISRVFSGVAQAGLFSAAVGVVARWFPKSERAIANGTLGSFMGVGGALAAGLTPVLLLFLEWRLVFLLYGGLGVVWAAGFYIWFRDSPREHTWVSGSELDAIAAGREGEEMQQPARIEGRAMLEMAASPAMWWICGQQFCRAAGEIFFASWFPTYLQEAHGVTVVESGLLTVLPVAARIGGGFLGGVISDWVLSWTGSLALARKGQAAVSLAACAGLVFAALAVNHPVAAVLLISAGALFASFAGPCAYTITIDIGDRHVPTVFSTMNMMGNFGAALFPLVAALIRVGTGSWLAVLILFATLYLAASLFWLLLRPSRSIFAQSLIRFQESRP